MKTTLLPSMLLATLIGAAQMVLLMWCWAYIAAYNPMAFWLIGHGVRGAALYALVFPVDFLVNVLLCLPAAFLLRKLRPARIWLYLALAVLPPFLWTNRLVPDSPHLAQMSWIFLSGWVNELLALPAAAWLLHVLSGTSRGRRQPALARNPA